MMFNMDPNNAPLVSVLVLTFNHELYISSCLKSVFSIRFPALPNSGLEILVLDDGSSDETLQIAQSLASAAPWPMMVSSQRQSGGKTAENSQKLIDAARGKYTLFLSGDDFLQPDFDLFSIVKEMEEDPTISMTFTRAVHVRVGNSSSRQMSIYTPEFRDLLLEGNPNKIYAEHLCRTVSRLFLQGTVVRAAFYKTFGGFDTQLIADDYAFMMRAFKAMVGREMTVKFLEDCMWFYRVHERNVHARTMRQRQSIFQVVSKYVPEDYWSTFDFGPTEPDDFEGLAELSNQVKLLFGSRAARGITRQMIRHFAHRTLKRKDWTEIRSLLRWNQSRLVAAGYLMPRLYRLLPFYRGPE